MLKVEMRKTSSLNVAVIEPSGRLYGSEFCLLDIIDGLSQEGFSWRVFVPRGAGFDSLLLARDIDCEFLIPYNLGELALGQKVPVYLKIFLRLRSTKPDLLYVNQAGSLRSAALYARFLNLPVVCQVQTLEDARWLSARPKLHGVVQAFICNSQFIASETKCDPQKKSVLYYGQPSLRLENAKKNLEDSNQRNHSGKNKNTFTVGILGRIAKSKGHYLFVEAAKLLVKKLPNCLFVVIGEGLSPEETNIFKKFVVNSGLEERFVFRGYRKDVQYELARLDVLAIPSIAEPFGRIFIDAAEHGVPAVVSDGGGLGELSRRFNTGERFKAGDANALASAIEDVASEYSESRRQFRVSAKTMLEKLSMDSYLSRVQRILISAANGDCCCEKWLGDE